MIDNGYSTFNIFTSKLGYCFLLFANSGEKSENMLLPKQSRNINRDCADNQRKIGQKVPEVSVQGLLILCLLQWFEIVREVQSSYALYHLQHKTR